MHKFFINRSILFFVVLISIFQSGCRNKNSVVSIQLNWKSYDPQSIPLAIREKEFYKGNLVINPSFEIGRYLSIDSIRKSYNINGWSRLGEKVYWTDLRNEELYIKGETSDGFHSIKIIREKADETDIQGEGVISDFIKVIPGNYNLTCDIRLENIESNMKRLSGNLLDAVNIRLFYYDKNKILIKSSVYNPSGDNIIDNSFKAYSLSGFDYIKELNWSKINCISNHFPFEEGDIPTEARFVRIFMGLKGTGTIWIDMVDFRYSSGNFSLLEKCEPFFNDSIEPCKMLIPNPVSCSKYSSIELRGGTKENTLYPVIVVPRNFTENDLKTLAPLKAALEKIIPVNGTSGLAKFSIVTRLDHDAIESGRLIFSFGNTEIFNEHAEYLRVQELKGHPQGYLIRRIQQLNNLIFVYAENPEGYYYAANVISNLLNISDGVYHHYDILDYPAFDNRGFIAKSKEEESVLPVKSLSDMVASRFNGIYIAPSSEQILFHSSSAYYNNHKQQLSTLRKNIPFFRYGFSGIDIMFTNNIPEKTDLISKSKNVDAAARSLAEIVNHMNPDEENGMIFSDRSLWEFFRLGSPAISLKTMDNQQYKYFIEAQEKFISLLNNSLKKSHRNNYIYFFPVFSDNTVMQKAGNYGKYYFKDYYFKDNEPEVLLWQGPAEYSFSIDGAELQRFQQETMKKLVWFDNTLMINRVIYSGKSNASIYPGKARLGSFFDPFHVNINLKPDDFYNKECIINLPDFSTISQIRLLTASDFLWNPGTYNPEFSLWKVLVNRFGKYNAIELLRFNDACFKLLFIAMTAEKEGLNPKLSREGEETMRIITEKWELVSKILAKDIPFLNQLTDNKNLIFTKFYQSKRKRGGLRE